MTSLVLAAVGTSLLSFASSPIISSLFGGLAGIITGIIQIVQRRDEAKLQVAKWAHELEVLKVQGNLDAARIAGNIALTREAGASEAFTKSIESDAKIKGESRFWTNVRVSVRPVLTYLYQVAQIVVFGVAVIAWWRSWCEAAQVLPLIEYIVIAIVNSASMTLSWYFGQRQIEKSAIAWGNATAGASVASKPTEIPSPSVSKK